MRRVLTALAVLYRRWRYVEEGEGMAVAAPAAAARSGSAGPGAGGDEAGRIRLAIGREEARIADCRRNGRLAMAREREATLHSLRNRLSALGL